MGNNETNPRLENSTIAIGAVGIAFALAAIAGFVVSYAIGIGFAVGAIICFVAAHNFDTLAKVHFSAPFIRERVEQRTHWKVFWLVSYISLGIAVFLSAIIGASFYIQASLATSVDEARLHLRYHPDSILVDVLKRKNVADFYNFSTTDKSWTILIIVFSRPMEAEAQNLRIEVEGSNKPTFNIRRKTSNLLIIDFNAFLAGRTVDVEMSK